MIETQTLETRWFISSSLPDNVYQWFCNHCPGKMFNQAETRTDYYLLTKNNYLMSLKLRQQKLELKSHQNKLKTISLITEKPQNNPWQGNIERWIKWTGEKPLSSSLQQEIITPSSCSPWLAVAKKRWQKRYQEVEIEMSQVTVKNQIWWSFALEMEESSERSVQQFYQVLEETYQTTNGLIFYQDQSYAYPSFLQRFND